MATTPYPSPSGGNPVQNFLGQIQAAVSGYGGPSSSGGSAGGGDEQVYWTTAFENNRSGVETYFVPGDPKKRKGPAIDGDPSIVPNERRYRQQTPYSADPITLPKSAALAWIYQVQGTKEYDRWGDKLVELGLIDEGDNRNFAVLDDWWQQVIDYTAKFTAVGKRLTPWQVVELMAATGASGSGGSGGSGGGDGAFTGRRTATSTSVDLTDPATAKALVNRTLSQILGRNANDDEVAAFRSAINSAEQASPTVTNTTTEYADGVATSQSSTTSGGLTDAGRQQMVMDDAMQKPEYGAYQAASTYFNAMTQAIQSPVG